MNNNNNNSKSFPTKSLAEALGLPLEHPNPAAAPQEMGEDQIRHMMRVAGVSNSNNNGNKNNNARPMPTRVPPVAVSSPRTAAQWSSSNVQDMQQNQARMEQLKARALKSVQQELESSSSSEDDDDDSSSSYTDSSSSFEEEQENHHQARPTTTTTTIKNKQEAKMIGDLASALGVPQSFFQPTANTSAVPPKPRSSMQPLASSGSTTPMRSPGAARSPAPPAATRPQGQPPREGSLAMALGMNVSDRTKSIMLLNSNNKATAAAPLPRMTMMQQQQQQPGPPPGVAVPPPSRQFVAPPPAPDSVQAPRANSLASALGLKVSNQVLESASGMSTDNADLLSKAQQQQQQQQQNGRMPAAPAAMGAAATRPRPIMANTNHHATGPVVPQKPRPKSLAEALGLQVSDDARTASTGISYKMPLKQRLEQAQAAQPRPKSLAQALGLQVSDQTSSVLWLDAPSGVLDASAPSNNNNNNNNAPMRMGNHQNPAAAAAATPVSFVSRRKVVSEKPKHKSLAEALGLQVSQETDSIVYTPPPKALAATAPRPKSLAEALGLQVSNETDSIYYADQNVIVQPTKSAMQAAAPATARTGMMPATRAVPASTTSSKTTYYEEDEDDDSSYSSDDDEDDTSRDSEESEEEEMDNRFAMYLNGGPTAVMSKDAPSKKVQSQPQQKRVLASTLQPRPKTASTPRAVLPPKYTYDDDEDEDDDEDDDSVDDDFADALYLQENPQAALKKTTPSSSSSLMVPRLSSGLATPPAKPGSVASGGGSLMRQSSPNSVMVHNLDALAAPPPRGRPPSLAVAPPGSSNEMVLLLEKFAQLEDRVTRLTVSEEDKLYDMQSQLDQAEAYSQSLEAQLMSSSKRHAQSLLSLQKKIADMQDTLLDKANVIQRLQGELNQELKAKQHTLEQLNQAKMQLEEANHKLLGVERRQEDLKELELDVSRSNGMNVDNAGGDSDSMSDSAGSSKKTTASERIRQLKQNLKNEELRRKAVKARLENRRAMSPV